tara:strand:- start:1036 stop:2031 length:996 start_codon:yes stop_codon:yes gene_type:complete
MKRRNIIEEDAVTHVIEFTIALTVFVIVLQAFTSSMNFRIGIDLNKNDNNIVMAREVISELTGSEGSSGDSSEWENNEYGTGSVQLRNGTTLGILNSDGEIDSDKCDSLSKYPYYPLKEELGVTEQLRIEVQTLVPKETVCLWGGNPDTASVSFESQRYLLYNDGTNSIPALLTVTIYEGDTPTSDLYLTEVMYSPQNNGFNYEWIEIYNPNDVAIFFNGWTIADDNQEDIIISNDNELITLPAKSVGILTSSPATFKETYLNYKYVFSVEDLAIGNGLGTNETIILSKNSYNDVFSYTSDDGANGNGKTLTRSCYNCADWNEAVSSPGTI